jgi:acyl-coenzyme A thioesterase PaaI-like protein
MNPSNAITADALAGDEAMDDFAVGREHAPAVPTDRIERTDRQQEGALGTPPSLPARVRQIVRPSRNFFERIYDNLEAFLSRLSMRDNFWNSILSMIWLPLAFFSGIRMKEIDASTFVARAVLPFRRFNRNWYRAMAGGALLANSEIAGGSYVFGICGADYTVVCKHLEYKFLRPCLGPAVYRIKAREDINALKRSGAEFNITVDMDILQQAGRVGDKDKRVGQCVSTFHVTPKKHHIEKAQRKGK